MIIYLVHISKAVNFRKNARLLTKQKACNLLNIVKNKPVGDGLKYALSTGDWKNQNQNKK